MENQPPTCTHTHRCINYLDRVCERPKLKKQKQRNMQTHATSAVTWRRDNIKKMKWDVEKRFLENDETDRAQKSYYLK